MSKRIIGIDVARAWAVIGMIIVNFKVVLGEKGHGWMKSFATLFEGKAAATFVVLAGVGLALMTKSAIKSKDRIKLKKTRRRIVKRAFFLFVVGLSYIAIWPADILHFYGLYMVITLLLLTQRDRVIIGSAITLILLFPLLMLVFEYELGWDFKTLDYNELWTINGFVRNLMYNGFHPVIPWTAFMLFGYWFGKQDLRDAVYVRKIFCINILIFIAIQLFSYIAIPVFSEGDQQAAKELSYIIGTHPMPPLPIYMFSGVSIALSIISACIIIAKHFENSPIIDALMKTGQLALTFYVAHVIIGMGMIEIFFPVQMGNSTIAFSLGYAIVFSILCIVFAVLWRTYKTSGPIEWIMRKITD